MRKRNIAMGLGLCLCISANGLDAPIEVRISLPPPAEVLEAVGETVQGVSDYLTAEREEHAPAQDMLYRIRNAANEPASQIGAYSSLERAVSACPPSYCVFDGSGALRYAG